MSPPELEILKWLLSQGPGTLIVVLWGPAILMLAIVLYFYRRDFVRILNREVDKNAVLITLVQENTAAQNKAAAAGENVSQAVQRLSELIDRIRERERL